MEYWLLVELLILLILLILILLVFILMLDFSSHALLTILFLKRWLSYLIITFLIGG
jgi:hypothetical protein